MRANCSQMRATEKSHENHLTIIEDLSKNAQILDLIQDHRPKSKKDPHVYNVSHFFEVAITNLLIVIAKINILL